jgi:hypothetical protein
MNLKGANKMRTDNIKGLSKCPNGHTAKLFVKEATPPQGELFFYCSVCPTPIRTQRLSFRIGAPESKEKAMKQGFMLWNNGYFQGVKGGAIR